MPATSSNLESNLALDAVRQEVGTAQLEPTPPSPEWVPHFLNERLKLAPPGCWEWRFVDGRYEAVAPGLIEPETLTAEASFGPLDGAWDNAKALLVPITAGAEPERHSVKELEELWAKARGGDGDAMIRVVNLCFHIFRWWRGAEYWAKKALATGHPEAAFSLGMLYKYGWFWDPETDRPVRTDPEVARRWFREARRTLFKALRAPEGQRKLKWYTALGFLLMNGDGGPKRTIRAIRLYREARRQYPGSLAGRLGKALADAIVKELPMPVPAKHERLFVARALLQYYVHAGQRQFIGITRRLLHASTGLSHVLRCPRRRVPPWRLPAHYLTDIVYSASQRPPPWRSRACRLRV